MILLDSIAGHARRQVAELRRSNSAMRAARAPIWLRALDAFPGERSIFFLLFAYAGVFAAFFIAGVSLNLGTPQSLAPELKDLSQPDTIRNLMSYMLGAQATMVGLIFPLALGLVTLIVQRDQGASTNIDVQIYYHESRSWSVGTSGLALAAILLIELGRPEAFLLRAVGAAETLPSVTAFLSLFLGLWLLANLLLTWQFLTTSLSFIRPAFRGASRKRYVAAKVIPSHLQRLLAASRYNRIDDSYFRGSGKGSWPFVLPEAAELMEGEREIVLDFSGSRVIRDIWVGPLRLAIMSWSWRSTKAGLATEDEKHDWMLGLPPGINHVLHGPAVICRRRGGVPLLFLERALIRLSFRMATPKVETRIEPSDVLEELADRVIVQMDRLAVTAFREAFSEMVGFHCFLLAAHTIKKDGALTSLAAHGYWASEHQLWLREYARLFERAAYHMEQEDTFIGSLATTVARLLPHHPDRLPCWVAASLFELPQYMVHRLGHWVEKNQNKDGDEPMPFAATRAYSEALRKIVGGSESSLSSAWKFGGETREASDDAAWSIFCDRWPLLFSHLASASYLVLAAHHHRDEMAGNGYRDLLLRWLTTLHATDADADGRAQMHSDLIVSDIFNGSWTETQRSLSPLMRFSNLAFPRPIQIASVSIANMHGDVRLLSALLLLHWSSHEDDMAPGIKSALQLIGIINPEDPDHAGRLTPLQIVQSFVRLRFSDFSGQASGYLEQLDTMVRRIDAMREGPQVAGRIYRVSGIFDISELAGIWFSLISLSASPQELDGIEIWLSSLGEDRWTPSIDGHAIEQLRQWLGRVADLWDNVERKAIIRAVVAAAVPQCNADANGDATQAVLRASANNLRHHLDRRLAEAPIDDDLIDALEMKVADTLENLPNTLPIFSGVALRTEQASRLRQGYRGSKFDKSDFVMDVRHDRPSNAEYRLGAEITKSAQLLIWKAFKGLERVRSSAHSALDLFEKLRRAGEAITASGQRPVALLPQTGPKWIEELDLISIRATLGDAVTFDPSKKRGGYRFTYAGIDFYRVRTGSVEIFPSTLLRTIVVKVSDPLRPAKLEILESVDALHRDIALRFAIATEWDEPAIISIRPTARAPRANRIV